MKRMFESCVVCTDRFYCLPLSAQALYFHLGMCADDDGFIIGVGDLIRTIGANDEDLQALVDSNFIILFDSGVVVVTDWRINNTIKKDLYIPTECVEEMGQLELYKKKYVSKKVPECFQNVSKNETPTDEAKHDSTDCQAVVDMYNNICKSLPKVVELTETRRRAIKARLKHYTVEDLEKAFYIAEKSDFLTRRVPDSNFKASFDWLLKESNLVKTLEGNYENRQAPKTQENAFQQLMDNVQIGGFL